VRRPVAVAGIGIVSAFGTSPEAFRDALLDGATAIAPISAFDTAGCRTTLAGEMKAFQPTDWISPMKLRRLDRTGVYAVAATKLALADAGVTLPADGDDGAGVMLGTWTAGGQSTQQFLEALFRSGPSGAPALLFDSTVGNSAAGLTGLEFKLRGPNVTVSHKEASGLAAIVGATDMLRERRANALISGGVDAVFETFFKAHDRFKVMAPDRQFSNRMSPFDAEASGFVMGEGAFAFWMTQPREGSQIAGPPWRGEVLGVSASSAAVPINSWPDQPGALARTMRLALEDAGLGPKDVSVVYASANATSLDEVEAQALLEVFGNDGPLVTSIKGALGECGASGSASCAAALLCGAAGWVPPIAGLSRPRGRGARLALAREKTALPGPVALVNSFASGGALFSAVVKAGPSRVI
jgi:3-oxoacyl-[acyl-carrier-protein] synthase II